MAKNADNKNKAQNSYNSTNETDRAARNRATNAYDKATSKNCGKNAADAAKDRYASDKTE